MAERPAVTKKAASLKGEERTKFLHDYNEAAYQKVLGVMKAENARLIPMKVEILNKVIRTDHDDDVQFVLYGSKDHEVLGTNKSATRAGMGAYQLGATVRGRTSLLLRRWNTRTSTRTAAWTLSSRSRSKDLGFGTVPGAIMDM